MEKETILAKIKKLQALAAKNSNQHEAAAAAAKAQALLFEHNLTAADVETNEPAPHDPYGRVEHTMAGANRTTVQWRRSLLNVLAMENFCKAVTIPNTTRMQLIGKRSNVETVLYLNSVLVREIERLAIEAARSVLSDRSAYTVSFCRGAVATIWERLKEQRRQSEAQATTTTATMDAARANKNALILRTATEELSNAVAHFFPGGLRKGTRSRVSHADGYHDGRRAGQGIGMHRGVGSRSAAGLIS